MIYETNLRVRFSETDAQGIANNANYLSYFEVGRVEWLRAAGLSYKELEERGYGFVVVEARIFYKKAARFDDELAVRTALGELKRVSLRFDYEVARDGEVITTGYTHHGHVNLASGRPCRIPKDLASLLAAKTLH